MHLRLILAAALAVGLSSAAQAQGARTVASCSGQTFRVGDSASLSILANGDLCVAGASGGSASGGSVTPAGTPGAQAQTIQGNANGVPVPVTAAPAVGAQEQDLRSTQTLNAATLNAAVTVPVNGQGTLGFALAGLTASGATLTFEQSEDGGTTWTIVNEVNAGTGVATSTRTTDGQTRIATSGRTNIRFRVSAVGTGTITVAYSLSVREGMVALTTPLPPGANVIGAVTTAGVTRARLTCTLPAYATGGNIVCTDSAGAQTTTACAANTACLVSAANANRKTAFFTNRTAGTTIDVGYSANVAPGNAVGIDGPSVTNGQGGNSSESPAHVGAYYAASAAVSTLVFVQGQ